MEYEEKIARLKNIISSMKSGVLFTGAGISVPSGIPDFRSESGLYSTKYIKDQNGKPVSYCAEQILSHSFFMEHGREFFNFYKDKMLYPDAKPNAAHIYFAKLEQLGKLDAIVTQNIDGLHQMAGAKNVFELHGSVYRNYCMACGKHGFDLNYVLSSDGEPRCDNCRGRVRPEVVLYEESLLNSVVSGAIDALENADVLLVVGTSLSVYPAAGLIHYFSGKELVLINKSATEGDRYATLVIHGDIEKVVKDLENK